MLQQRPILQGLIGTSALNPVRLLKYAIVGLVAFAIDFAMLLLLVDRLPLLVANTIAFLVANAANFVMAHSWVFGHPLGYSAKAHYFKVLGISLSGLGLNDALVWVGVVALACPLLLTKLVATVVVFGWNFTARALWVYNSQAQR